MKLIPWRRNVADEVQRELEFHVEMVVRELVAAGTSPDAARAEALRRFGDRDSIDAACRRLGNQREHHMRRVAYLDALWLDIRFAARQLLRTPAFTVIAVLTLAIGTGATTAIFSVVRSVVLRPFPWAHPDRVMMLTETWNGQRGGNVSPGNYLDWRDNRTFAHIGAEQLFSFNIADAETPERVSGGRASASFFDVFGVRPMLGRTFTAAEDAPGNEFVVVLSHQLWTRRFAGDSGVIGRDVSINQRNYQIVGVMPPGFDPTASREELWVPFAFTPEQIAHRDEHRLMVFGVLREGVSMEQAQADLATVMARLRVEYPQDNQGRGIAIMSLSGLILDNLDTQLFILFGAVALVLLIACGNVANLLLARGSARAREIAVRSAIGAGRGRIVRQLLTESAVLAFVSTVAGLGIAHATIQGLIAVAPPGIPRLSETQLDLPVMLFAVALAAVCSLVFGLAPAWRAARQDVQGVLKEGGRGISGVRDRMRAALVVGEVAFALTLLVGAGLLIRSGLYLRSLEPGFDPRGVVTARVSLPASTYAEPAQVVSAFENMVRELRSLPGVEGAGFVSQAPLGPGGNSNGLLVEGKALQSENFVNARLRIASPGYLEVMRIPLKNGRLLNDGDVAGALRVMVISETLAEQLWPGEEPIGKRLMCCEGSPTDPTYKTVVGVVGDVRSRGPTVAIMPEFYMPARQMPAAAWNWVQRSMALAVRGTENNTAPLAGAMRTAVKRVDPSLPVFRVNAASDDLRASTAQTRFYTTLLTALGGVGLLLALVGIYGVIAYLVTLRTHEIGIRLALGARGQDIVGLMMKQGLVLVIGGIAVGAAASLALTRTLRTVLFGVEERDPATFIAVAVILLVVGLVAVLIPAGRASSVSPTQALQS